MAHIDFITDRRPRNGSDYCITLTHETPGRDITLLAVLDTIGKPTFRGFKKLLRQIEQMFRDLTADPTITGIDQLALRAKEALLVQNEAFQQLTDEPIFGFGLVLALIFNDRCHFLSLGDCRGYLVRPIPPGAEPETELLVRCLTSDHNRLFNVFKEDEPYIFLQNEFQTLSRTLHCFWGMADANQVRTVLDLQDETITLQEADVLLLLTDGVFLPIARGLLDLTNFRLTKDEFVLVPWLRQRIEHGEFLASPAAADAHQALLEDMIHEAEQITGKKSRYRDDIAAIAARVS